MVTETRLEPPIFGAPGPAVTLAGASYRLKVLPFAEATALQEIFLEVLPETGQFDGADEGEIVINALGVSRAYGKLDGILQQFITGLPDGIVARSARAELMAAINAIFQFNGYHQARQIIKNLAALASTAIQTAMATAVSRVQPELNQMAADLMQTALSATDAPASSDNAPPPASANATTAPAGSASGPASTTAS